MAKVLHKKSNRVVNGNPALPNAANLDYGEIAINYKAGKETIAIKNDEGDIATFVTGEQLSSQNPFKFSESNASAITSTVGDNSATSQYAFAVGNYCVASGESSHAEGYSTYALGEASHAEGYGTTAETNWSHTEGDSSVALGESSHAEGSSTKAYNDYEHAEGAYNVSNTGSTSSAATRHSVGIGSSNADRKNAFEIMQNGDVYVYGIGDYDGTNATAASADTLQDYFEKKEYVTATALNALNDAVSALTGSTELVSNKVTSITSASTDTQYPSAKAVYTKINGITPASIGAATSSHTHDEYSLTSHTHSEYSLTSHTHTAAEVGAAASSHTHSEYSLTSHTHTAAEVGASPSGHTHSEYSLTSHTHSEYSLTSHTHTAAEVGAAPSSHTHSEYSLTSHTHTVDTLPVQTTLTSVNSEIPTGKAVMDYVGGLISSPVNYKGAITNGTLPSSATTVVGDLYVVQTTPVLVPAANTGTGDAATAETGDYLIARDEDTWDIIEKNLNGAVTSNVGLTGNKFVLGNGAQTIKASQYGPSDFASATALTNHVGDTTIHVTTAQTTAWDAKANTASPAFTGTPTAPTPAAGDNSTRIATTSFVNSALTSGASALKPEYFATGNTITGGTEIPNGSYTLYLFDENGDGATYPPGHDNGYAPLSPVHVRLNYYLSGTTESYADNTGHTIDLLFMNVTDVTTDQYQSDLYTNWYFQPITLSGKTFELYIEWGTEDRVQLTVSNAQVIRPGNFNVLQNGVLKGTYSTNQNGTTSANIIETQLSTASTGSGNVLTDITVSDHQITKNFGMTISNWATASTKPTYTASEVGALSTGATLDNVADGSTRKLSNYSLTSHTHTASEVGALSTGATLDNVADGTTRKLSNYSLTSHTHTASEVGALSTGATLDNVADGTTRKLSNYATQANFTAHTASTAVHLPTVTSSDNGKILRVVNGAWALVTPVTVYTGSSAPDSSLGNDGDIYLQTQ